MIRRAGRRKRERNRVYDGDWRLEAETEMCRTAKQPIDTMAGSPALTPYPVAADPLSTNKKKKKVRAESRYLRDLKFVRNYTLNLHMNNGGV